MDAFANQRGLIGVLWTNVLVNETTGLFKTIMALNVLNPIFSAQQQVVNQWLLFLSIIIIAISILIYTSFLFACEKYWNKQTEA